MTRTPLIVNAIAPEGSQVLRIRSVFVGCLVFLTLLTSCAGVIVHKGSYDSPSKTWTLNAHQFLRSRVDYDQLSVKDVHVSIFPLGASDKPVYREILKIRAEQNLGWQATWISDTEVVLTFDDRETGVEPGPGNVWKTKDGRLAPLRLLSSYKFHYNPVSGQFDLKK